MKSNKPHNLQREFRSTYPNSFLSKLLVYSEAFVCIKIFLLIKQKEKRKKKGSMKHNIKSLLAHPY